MLQKMKQLQTVKAENKTNISLLPNLQRTTFSRNFPKGTTDIVCHLTIK